VTEQSWQPPARGTDNPQPVPSLHLDEQYAAALAEHERLQEFRRQLFALTPRIFVTPVLVALNIIVFVVMAANGVSVFSPEIESLIQWGANVGPKTLLGEWWRLFTSMFLHIGLLHIGFNMWILWSSGPLVERLMGNLSFLIVYLISGIFGSLASAYWHPDAVSAGASGAIFGVFGAVLGFVLPLRRSIPLQVFTGLKNSVLTFVVLNLLLGSAIPGIDMAAHIGGLVAGFVCGLVLSRPLDEDARASRRVRSAVLAVVATAVGFALVQVMPVNLRLEIVNLAQVDQTTREEMNRILEEIQQGKLEEQAAPDYLEKTMLPEWKSLAERLSKVKDLSPEETATVEAMRTYVTARLEEWELLLAAFREQTPQLMAAAIQKGNAADQALQQLNERLQPKEPAR